MIASAALLEMPPEPRSPLSFLIEGKRLPRFEVASSVECVLILVNLNNRRLSRDGDAAERNLGNRICRSSEMFKLSKQTGNGSRKIGVLSQY